MADLLVGDIINNLIKLKNIMYELDKEKMNKKIKDIDEIIRTISKFSCISIKELDKYLDTNKTNEKQEKNKKKPSFKDNIKLLEKGQFKDMKGVKLNYEIFKDKTDVIKYFSENEKDSTLKATTVMDLKLLYFILTGRIEEIKGKKEIIYENIKRNIKARKRGKAFKNY